MIGGYHSWTQELNTRIERERANKAAELGSGMAGDFADYRYGVGVIEGLRLASEIAEEIIKEQERG